jgi:hypothetical protein
VEQQVPQWLMAAVAAAGMTAYAEDLIDPSNKNGALEGVSAPSADPPDTVH